MGKRICSTCGKPMMVGYVIAGGDDYHCSDACLHKHYDHSEYLALYAGLDYTDADVLKKIKAMTSEELDNLHEESGSDTYWTEWEADND